MSGLVGIGHAGPRVKRHWGHRVVHQAPADAGEIDDDIDTERRQLVGRTDAGAEQDRGALDRTRRDDDLSRAHGLQLAARIDAHADDVAVLEEQLVDEAAAANREIEPVAGLREVAEVGRPAHHPAPVHRERRDAGAFGIVLVVGLFEAERNAGVVEAALHGLQLVALPAQDGDRAALAVEVSALVLVVLERAEVGQALLPGPAVVAGHLGPAVVVAGCAADRDAGVDRGGAADQLAARYRLLAAGHERAAKAPVVAGRGWFVDAGDVFGQRLDGREVGARFEQQHRSLGVLTEPGGEHGAR